MPPVTVRVGGKKAQVNFLTPEESAGAASEVDLELGGQLSNVVTAVVQK